MGKLLTPQAALFHAPVEKDVVYTPEWLAELVVAHFAPAGRVLDPCRGDGAFHRLIPGAEWCEIAEGRDFFAWGERVDWCIGNPPYSCLLGWIRHSFKVADNVVYLMPLHRVFASFEFMDDIRKYGGIKEILAFAHVVDRKHEAETECSKLRELLHAAYEDIRRLRAAA